MIAYSTPAAVLAVSIVLTLLCTIMVMLRFVPHKKKPLVDDWLCLASWFMILGMVIGIITGVARHSLAYSTPPKSIHRNPHVIEVEKIEWAVQMIQVLQLGFTKLSFVFFFRRVFVTHNRDPFSIASWTMIGLLILWTASFFLSFLFACRGHFSQWWLQSQTCIGLEFENAFALSDTLMDFLVILMPLPMIWKLHMNLHRKIAVTGIFALGTLAVIISIVRLVIFYQAKNAEHQKNVDHDLLITLILFWSLIESTVALTAACLPPVYGLIGHRAVDSLVRSVHSLRSLGSRESMRSGRSEAKHGHPSAMPTTRLATGRGETRVSDASRAPILPMGLGDVEALATATGNSSGNFNGEEGLKDGQIKVERAFEVTDKPA